MYTPRISIDDSLTLPEGEEWTLDFTTNAPSVVWASDNEDVATVDQNGTVTGHGAGKATVTATVTGADGTTQTEYCTVYVYLADDVYYISNQFSSMDLFVQNLSINNTNVVQIPHATNVEETQIIRQLWKIAYLGEGLYTIRPLHNLSRGLYSTNNNAVIANIGASDDSDVLTSSAEWIISIADSGYVIQNNYDEKALQLEGNGTEANGNVIIGTPSNSLMCRWNFVQATSIPIGVILYDTATGERVTNPDVILEPNAVKTLADMNLCVATYPEYNMSLSWTSSHTDKATVNTSGAVTAVHYGNSIITGTLFNGKKAQFTVDIMSIPEGTYFLRNKHMGYYADIKNPSAPSNGREIHQWEFNGDNSQKWIFEYRGSGYYTLKSANYTTAYYLGVRNDSTAENADIVLRTGDITNGMKWRVTITLSGAYRLTPKTGDYALCTSTEFQINGEKLVQGGYTNDNCFMDEWRLYDTVISYVNYYDSTLTGSNSYLAGYITSANEFAISVYSWFGLEFRMDGDARRKYDALADQCNHSSNSPCTDACGLSCNDSHHKNLRRMSDQLFNEPRENSHIYVMWSNRNDGTYCDGNDNNIHEPQRGIGVVYYNRPVIQFAKSIGNSSDAIVWCMSMSLAHETAHVLGMDDVYDNEGHDIAGSTICVMEKFEPGYVEEFYSDVLAGITAPFCDSCTAKIQECISKAIISGNQGG